MTLSEDSSKDHIHNSFIRNLCFNFSYVYINSFLIARDGPQSFSKLFLLASLASIVCYSIFIFLKPKTVTWIYSFLIFIILLVTITYTLTGQRDTHLLYLIGSGIFLSDLISPNIAANNIQMTTHPFYFREVFSKVTFSDLTARVISSISILLINFMKWETYVFPIFILLLSFTLFWNFKIINLLKNSNHNVLIKTNLTTLKKSLRNFAKSKFLYFSLIIVIWSTLSKFLVEYVFYIKAHESFNSSVQLSNFMSLMNLSIIVCSMLFQKKVASKLLVSWNLSSLLSALPLIVLGGSALSLSPAGLVGAILFQAAFLIFNKSIQIPTSRHCMLHVREDLRHSSFYLQSIFITFFGVLVSSFCQSIKGTWSYYSFIFFLIAVTIPILFIVFRMDEHYVRNIWRNLKHRMSDDWSNDLSDLTPIEPIASKQNLGEVITNSDSKTNLKYFIYNTIFNLQNNPADLVTRALKTYYTSYDKDSLSRLVNWHKSLLLSKKTSDKKLGLTLCEMTGLRCYDKFLENLLSHQPHHLKDGHFANEINIVLKSNTQLSDLCFKGIQLEDQFRLRYLFAKYLQRGDYKIINGLRRLVEFKDPNTLSTFLKVFMESKYKDMRETLRSCLVKSSNVLNLWPLLNYFIESKKEQELASFYIIQEVDGNRFHNDINKIIEAHQKLPFKQLSISNRLKLLIILEWGMGPSTLEMRKSLLKYESLNNNERLLLKEMHLELCKKTKDSQFWSHLILSLP